MLGLRGLPDRDHRDRRAVGPGLGLPAFLEEIGPLLLETFWPKPQTKAFELFSSIWENVEETACAEVEVSREFPVDSSAE